MAICNIICEIVDPLSIPWETGRTSINGNTYPITCLVVSKPPSNNTKFVIAGTKNIV